MPFCTHCGAQTGDGARFCSHCGSGQDAAAVPPAGTANAAAPPQPPLAPIYAQPNHRLRPNIAALLCYIPSFGWLPSVIFLAVDDYRRNRYVHFHALQGLFLFIAYYLVSAVSWGLRPGVIMDPFSIAFRGLAHWSLQGALHMALLIIQVVGMVKAAKGEPFHLPILGDIAERSMV
jgi:uncharacterized membrane protein